MEAYLVTDRRVVAPEYFPRFLRLATEAGVDRIQIREKDLDGRDLFHLALETIEITRKARATIFINDRVDVALAASACGVHLGQAAMPVRVARSIGGEDLVVGASTHTLDEALRAQEEGPDYLFFGPIFSTPSKSTYGPPVGISKLEAVLRRVQIPVYAIGGISPENLDSLRPLPLPGVAMIAAFVRAASVAELVRDVHRKHWS